MKSRFTLPLLVTALTLLGTSSWGQTTSQPSGSWLLRVRGIQAESANRSDAFTYQKFNFAADAVRTGTKSGTEVALAHSLGNSLSLEVGQTSALKRTLYAVGSGPLGTAEQTVTTAILQYHTKTTTKGIQAYAGVGVGSTRYTKSTLSLFNNGLAISNGSGLALQIGVDYKLSGSLYLNLDYKNIAASSDLTFKSSGAKLTTAKTDPNIYGGGIAYRF